MSITFMIAVFAFCVLAVGFVVFPLLWDAGGRRRSRREVNAVIFEDRLAELDYDLAQGTLTREQYDAAVSDLEEDLVLSGAVDREDGPVRASVQRPLMIASGAIAAIGVPLLALGLYGNVGFSDVVPMGGAQGTNQRQAQTAPQSQGGGARVPAGPHDTEAFEELAVQLRARLAANPDDRMGWVLLGRTLVFLERFEESSEAFAEAVSLDGHRDPDLLIQYADVLSEASGGLQGKPKELLEQALELAPEHPQGLWMAGSAAYYEADYAGAREYWERLLTVLPPESEAASIIRSNLDEVTALAGDG
jgi:cytochrome c-type biogenesis protein CcmH